jgi:hypothetical protein
VAASISVSAATATLTPSSALAAGTTYTATVAGTVTDTNGNPLASPANWTFTTGPDSTHPHNGGGTGGGTSSGGATTKAIPQIPVGAYDNWTHYGTIIEIMNPNGSAIAVSGNFFNQDGTPSTLTIATNMSSQPTFSGSFSNINLPANSILVLSVGTTSGTMPQKGTTNWAMISATNTISVSTFFELRHRGDESLYSRVGIPSSRTDMSSFLIPRVREKQTDEGHAEIDTGFAIVNTGSKTATITGKLFDSNGNVVGSLNFPLAANSQKAGVASSEFAFPSGEAIGRQYQYMLFSSDQPTIGAAAIAFEGGNLTSFPVDPLN